MYLSLTVAPFQPSSFAFKFVYYKNTHTPSIMQFGAVEDLEWTSGCAKQGSRKADVACAPA